MSEEELKTVPNMGSKRFYEHAQNLLGGVKKEESNNRTYGATGKFILPHTW